jgi:hypothetical protein
MSEALAGDPYRAYREAVRLRVCAVCLDGTDDSGCGLTGGARCPVQELLPLLVETIREVGTNRERTFAAAVESRVCSHCDQRDGFGLCRLRRDGRCAVVLYLPLIVEAIQSVDPG